MKPFCAKGDICMEPLLLLLPPGPDDENLLQSNGDRMSCLWCLSLPLAPPHPTPPFAPPVFSLRPTAAVPAGRVSVVLPSVRPLCLNLIGIIHDPWSVFSHASFIKNTNVVEKIASPGILVAARGWNPWLRHLNSCPWVLQEASLHQKRGIKVQTGLD